MGLRFRGLGVLDLGFRRLGLGIQGFRGLFWHYSLCEPPFRVTSGEVLSIAQLFMKALNPKPPIVVCIRRFTPGMNLSLPNLQLLGTWYRPESHGFTAWGLGFRA